MEIRFARLTHNFVSQEIHQIMPALGLKDEPLPLWWTADFILASPEGTPLDEEQWIVGEFNCSCVGVSKCLAAYCKADTPDAKYDDITAEDKEDKKERKAAVKAAQREARTHKTPKHVKKAKEKAARAKR